MKLSMWHILQDLEDFQPEYSITDGAPRISGLHLQSRWDNGDRLGQYAYLEMPDIAAAASTAGRRAFTIVVSNGPDTITLRDIPDASVIVNRLMALIATFNDWEARLRHAAGRDDLQEVVDIATEKLNNPILLFDMESNVLAMSALFLDDNRDPFWSTCRQTRRVPIGYSAQSMTLENGQFASWTREPAVYTMPDGSRSIGNFISVNGEMVAGFALHEADNKIRPGDLYLVRLAEEMLAGSLRPRGEGYAQRTMLQTLQDMLSGVKYEDHVYGAFRLPCKAPWRLAVVDNPFHKRGDIMYLQLLLPRLRSLMPQCLSLEFDGCVVVLAPVEEIESLLEVVGGGAEKPWFSVCLSLPFDNLRLLHDRYRQTAFVLETCGGKPGVYYGEAHALEYLAARGIGRQQRLAHPLLAALKAHDAQKNSELYDTLFQYLIHERSIQKGAAALHVHKNTYSYRLDRIRELASVDLDDPLTRLYLMFSYVIDGALDQVSKPE